MKYIKFGKVCRTLWSDGEIHCDCCGAIMYCCGYQDWWCPSCDD